MPLKRQIYAQIALGEKGPAFYAGLLNSTMEVDLHYSRSGVRPDKDVQQDSSLRVLRT